MAFAYPPLPPSEDSLRLLTLEPGQLSDPLRGTLRSFAFSSRPRYVALSYTWENYNSDHAELPPHFDGSPRTALRLDGQDLVISHNLTLALLYLRSSEHSLSIWVDAVCIDQSDTGERNAQVALMGFIYRRAVAVVVWLGAPIYNKALCSDIVEAMASEWSHGKIGQIAAALADRKSFTDLDFTYTVDLDACQSKYWTRLWIVQEFCLAHQLLVAYGGSLWSIKHLEESARGRKMLAMETLISTRKRRFTDAMKLENLVERFAAQGCSEIRDRIYSLVGLSCDTDAQTSGGDWKDTLIRNARYDTVLITDSEEGRRQIVIDYETSLFQIWKNMLSRYNDLESTRIHRTVRLSAIVQAALGNGLGNSARAVVPSTDNQRSTSGPDATRPSKTGEDEHDGLVCWAGYVACEIIHIGPSYSDYTGSFKKFRDWTRSLEHHYTKPEHLEMLREGEETYAARITTEYSVDRLKQIAKLDSRRALLFRGDVISLNRLKLSSRMRDLSKRVQQLGQAHENQSNGRQTEVDGTREHALREEEQGVQHRKMNDDTDEDGRGGGGGRVQEPVRFIGTNRRTGLAPPDTRVGDYIVCFDGCDAAVVVSDGVLAEEEASLTFANLQLLGRADIFHYPGERVADPHRDAEKIGIVSDWSTLQRISSDVETFPDNVR